MGAVSSFEAQIRKNLGSERKESLRQIVFSTCIEAGEFCIACAVYV